MNGNKILDLPSPTSNSEPVTKGYADTHYSGGSGHRGPKEDKGDTGPQGPKGDTGLQGPQGPRVTQVREDLRVTPDRKV